MADAGRTPDVVLAATPRGWASRLHARAADHGGVVVRTTVLAATDLLAERADVVVIDDICSFLTPALVASLRAGGRRVIVVHEDASGRALLDLGVDATVPADIEGAALVGEIRRVAALGHPIAPTVDGDVVAVGATPPSTGEGAVVGVAGPAGGVGVTEVALELAALIAETGRPTVMVDLDEGAPAAAQRLALPLQPNVLNALDAAARGRATDGAVRSVSRRTRLGAVAGMADPGDWATVAEDALGALLAAWAQRGWIVVADLGHCPPATETLLGRRFGHAAAIAASCTELVVVASPSPVSLSRAAGLRSTISRGAGVRALLNRDAGTASTRGAAAAELGRCLRAEDVRVAPEDPKVPEAAWDGRRVASGRFRRAVRDAAGSWGWL